MLPKVAALDFTAVLTAIAVRTHPVRLSSCPVARGSGFIITAAATGMATVTGSIATVGMAAGATTKALPRWVGCPTDPVADRLIY